MVLVAVHAQTSQPAASNPASLPGDTPLPSLDYQLHKDLGPPAGTSAQKQPAFSAPSLALDLALEAAQTAIAACRADGYHIGVAVSDPDGALIVGLAADGAAPGRIYVALRKGITAAAFTISTLDLREKILTHSALLTHVRANMSLLSGGEPLVIQGHVVGAVAASGSTGNEDDYCARKGAKKIQARLR
jgi:uncharacterized protein GlcG (DUF336 family)